MIKQVTLAVAALFIAAGAAHAGPQQEKMKACNAEAKEKNLKGPEHKEFVSGCLKKVKATQQEKMKTCNADAKTKNLKGEDRKKFMSDCLKG